ncbi:MAG: hypothetical protein ACO1OT_07060 [Heyndrickxia sp.]
MKKVALSLMMVVLMISIYVWIPKQTFACSCAMGNTPDQEYKKSEAVFQGKVIKKETKRTSLFTRSSDDPVQVTFSVQKVWKGIDTRKIIIQTALSEASCGYSFHNNQEYIVYATKRNGKLQVQLCSRTNQLSKAAEDVQYLGKPIKVEKELKKGAGDEHVFPWQKWVITGVLLVLLIPFLTLMVIKILKKNRK